MTTMPDRTTRHPLNVPTGDAKRLLRVFYETWHHFTHSQAGRQRVAHAQLRLSTAWRDSAGWARAQHVLHELAQHIAASGTKVEVLLVASTEGVELHLRWESWHAPPLATFLDPPPVPAHLDPHRHQPHKKDPAMKLPFFTKTVQPQDNPQPTEPRLAPQPMPAARSSGAQLPLALSQVAEHIARQEVHDLLELGMSGRYRLFTLSFWVSAANQPALRNLMEINQRDPRAAKRVVEAAFAKSSGAALLDTSRLALVFTPGDALPRDAAEVLIVSGRDTVTLAYSYQGEIELPSTPTADADGRPTCATNPAMPATGATPATTPLCLWLQMPQQAVPQRWLVKTAATVGADAACEVPVDWSRVSGQHLRLLPLPQGGWQVQDDSRNGTLCLDAEQLPSPGNPPERPLPKGQAMPLPRAGSLRLGGSAQDPLLHFAQLGQPAGSAAVPAQARAAATRRMTELGPVVATHSAEAAPAPRGTRV